MILYNHGLLTAGSTIAEAFVLMYYLEKACEAQILAQSSGSQLVIIPQSVCEKAAKQWKNTGNRGQRDWSALLRWLEREDPAYKN